MERSTTSEPERPSVREVLIRGTLGLVDDRGAEEMSVRQIAEASGRSTMCVYSKFGGRRALLDAVHERAVEELLAALPGDGAPVADVAAAFREHAIAHPRRAAWLLAAPEPADGRAGRRARVADALVERLQATAERLSRDRAVELLALLVGLATLEDATQAAGSAMWDGPGDLAALQQRHAEAVARVAGL